MSEAERGQGLEGLNGAARRAVAAAAREARALGTSRVGTEHLLLGILATDTCGAAAALAAAGASLNPTRRKVAETNIATAGAAPGMGAPQRSPRAERALHRAFRFAKDQRSPVVRSEHLLLGVLDVEGTAGQVLRGLGTDVDRVRAALLATDPSIPEPDDPPSVAAPIAAADARPPICPRCAAPVSDGLAASRVPAGQGRVTVFSCPSCGTVLGVAPTGPG